MSRSPLSGRPGSGKSTLLDVILGMLEPDAGDISVDARPLDECREPWQRSIGYVPQDVYLVDDTFRANVALGWYGSEIDDERVADAIRSGGSRRRRRRASERSSRRSSVSAAYASRAGSGSGSGSPGRSTPARACSCSTKPPRILTKQRNTVSSRLSQRSKEV